MAMAAKHPIAYYTMQEIMRRLWDQADVSNVKVVFTTGPDLLKAGYAKAVCTTEAYESIFNVGIHVSITH